MNLIFKVAGKNNKKEESLIGFFSKLKMLRAVHIVNESYLIFLNLVCFLGFRKKKFMLMAALNELTLETN